MARRKDMHWSDVKCALEKMDRNLASIAHSLGVSESAVYKIKRYPNARVQTAIAKALRTTPEAIWPTRYYVASGQPIRPSIWKRNNSRATPKGNVKNMKAP